jgi:hypothetical protein
VQGEERRLQEDPWQGETRQQGRQAGRTTEEWQVGGLCVARTLQGAGF